MSESTATKSKAATAKEAKEVAEAMVADLPEAEAAEVEADVVKIEVTTETDGAPYLLTKAEVTRLDGIVAERLAEDGRKPVGDWRIVRTRERVGIDVLHGIAVPVEPKPKG